MAADQLRLMHYASRGELERAAEFQERTELHVLQGGTTWQTDVCLPAHMFMVAMLTEDALALRQAWEQLARQAKEIPSLEVYAEAAHAGYLAARGDGREALAQLELLVTRLPPRQRIGWAVVRLHLAQLLNRGGDHARAKEVVLEVTSRLSPADYDFVFPYLDTQRHLALAEFGLGNFAEAVRILDGLLAEPRAPDHPLWLGLLHKARAQVALRQGDGEAFRHHLAQLERWFRATRNPCLVAQWERLAAAGAALGLCEHGRGGGSEHPSLPSLASGTELARLLARCTVHERLPQALDLLVNGSGARAGYMYGLRGGALELLAACPDGEAPAAVREALHELLEEARVKLQRLSLRPGARVAAAASHPDQMRTETSFEQTVKERQAGAHRLLVLAAGSSTDGEVVGGIALELAAGARSRFATEHLTALAEVVRGTVLVSDAQPRSDAR
jgi:tetratricopeptide (TPR) repeat protein